MAVNSDERMDKMMQMMQAMMTQVDSLVEKQDSLVEKQDSLVEKQDSLQKQVEFVTPLYRVHPVPEDVVSQLTDKTFHETAKKYYRGTDSCVILGQLFSLKKSRKYARHWFPAVAEHIVPKARWTVAENWGFHTTDAKNALLFLKDVELKYQAGRLTLIPAEFQQAKDELILLVEISEALKDTVIKYVNTGGDRQCSKFAPVKGKEKGRGELKELKFRDLHDQQISVCPPPHMRALFLKAEMAHRQHQELTSPSKIVDRYTQHCPSMTRDLIQRLLASNSVGPA